MKLVNAKIQVKDNITNVWEDCDFWDKEVDMGVAMERLHSYKGLKIPGYKYQITYTVLETGKKSTCRI